MFLVCSWKESFGTFSIYIDNHVRFLYLTIDGKIFTKDFSRHINSDELFEWIDKIESNYLL